MDDEFDPVTFELDKRLLRCDECGDVSTGRAEGWRAVWDCDDELATFCTECWAVEFERD